MYKFRKFERIYEKREIIHLLRHSKKIEGHLLTLFVSPSEHGFSRLGLHIPGKLCNAAKRNRWKRLIRETFRLNKHKLAKNLDILVEPIIPPGKIKRDVVEEEFLLLLSNV